MERRERDGKWVARSQGLKGRLRPYTWRRSFGSSVRCVRDVEANVSAKVARVMGHVARVGGQDRLKWATKSHLYWHKPGGREMVSSSSRAISKAPEN